MAYKPEIQWSPSHIDKFITWGTEIYLYEVQNLKDARSPFTKISPTKCGKLIESNSNLHYVKCVDIFPDATRENLLLAIGQANGKVVLTTIGPSREETNVREYREFIPRFLRQCNVVAWNPLQTNILCAGFDKYRSDCSVMIWDVTKCPFLNETMTRDGHLSAFHQHATTADTPTQKPLHELASSEFVNSVAWSKYQPQTLVVGMNSKHIRIFDMRDPFRKALNIATRSVDGCCFNNYNEMELASFIDNHIHLWDMRNLDKPALVITQPKNLVKIGWSPTRGNLLASLQRDSSIIHLHDIQHTIVSNDEVEPSNLERTVKPGPSSNITSFSWHAYDENRLLTITPNGITDYTFLERITLNWAPSCKLLWNCSRSVFKFINDKNAIYNEWQDSAWKMKTRACKDYGLKKDLWKNGELADDPMVKKLWDWLYMSFCLVEESSLRFYGSKHPGVRQVLKLDDTTNGNSNTRFETLSWTEGAALGTSLRVYRNEDRDFALQLCGWRSNKDQSKFKLFLDRIESENFYTKAAAIAVFNLKLTMAIEILNRGAEKSQSSNLTVVAMALAGFSDDKTSIWRQFCQNTLANVTDAYLRTMFAFLTSDNDNYDGVLNEIGLDVEDRVAFACIYLNDAKLTDYLKSLTNDLIEMGDLSGILLTGTTVDGLNVLQKFIDNTGDVQSASLFVIKAFPNEIMQHDLVQCWIPNYRSFLDSWRMWTQRALSDIAMNENCSSRYTSGFVSAGGGGVNSYMNEKTPQQVLVSCNFCGKSVSSLHQQSLHRGRGTFNRISSSGADKSRLSSCPNCRKPLPRCSICLMNMGTSIKTRKMQESTSACTVGDRKSLNDSDSLKLLEYESWFAWCQTCRHGGHAAHLTDWFSEFSECPVSGCTCRCNSIDL